jgi:MFS family permease
MAILRNPGATVATRFRWLIIAVILAVVVVDYADRSAISFAPRPLPSQFGITTAGYWLISSAFAVGYLVFALLSGPLSGRFGPRRILLTGVIAWSLVSMIAPASGGFTGLLLIRIVLGTGATPGFRAATKITSRWLRRAERGFALALAGGVAVSGSLLIGGPIIAELAESVGWRGMFWILSAAGLLWAVAAAACCRTPRSAATTGSPRGNGPISPPASDPGRPGARGPGPAGSARTPDELQGPPGPAGHPGPAVAVSSSVGLPAGGAVGQTESAGEPGRNDDVVRCQVMDRGAPETEQRGVDATAQDVQHILRSGLSIGS